MKFRKKPIVIDATQWMGWDFHEEGELGVVKHSKYPMMGWIQTLEGGHIVTPTDWIITGVVGERYPCKDAIFRETYEEVVE